MDLLSEYRETRTSLFAYMKSIDDIRLIRKLSNEITNLDYKITRINEMALFDMNKEVKVSYVTVESCM